MSIKKPQIIKGYDKKATFPDRIVSMVTFRDMLLVATVKGVFKLNNDTDNFIPIKVEPYADQGNAD
jgi:hypothetical protein